MERAALLKFLSELIESGIGLTLTIQTVNLVQTVQLPSQPKVQESDPCKRDILLTLEEVGHRLTTSRLLDELERRGRVWGESTVRLKLSQLVDDGKLDNDQRADPKGYGVI